MRQVLRWISRTTRWGFVLLGVIVLLSGCKDSSTEPKRTVVSTPIDLTTAGSIRVDVRYNGEVPPPKELNMGAAPQCAAAYQGPVYDQSFLVKDGRLGNAVVWIKEGFGDRAFPVPTEVVVFDQKGCVYHPRVAAAMVSQPVEFQNSDPEPHNVHGRPEQLSGWNFMMSRKGSTRKLTFDKAEIGIPVGCDIHPWMQAYLSVIDNPYFGVTPADGSVTLKPVPPGDYVIGVWHEKLGTKEQRLKLEPKGSASLAVTYQATR